MTSFIQTVEDDIVAAWGAIEATVEADALVVWNDFKSAFTALLPQEYALVKSLILKVIPDVLSGDIAAIETAVLNSGAEELALVEKLGSEVVQAIIAVVKTG